MIQQFLSQFTDGKQPLSLPKTFRDIYAEIIKQLIKKYPNSKKRQYPLDDGSIEAIVGHFYRLFSTHSLKFFRALITIELNALKANSITNILNWPNITFIDIGCGAGAGSIALLALLESYQHFLEDNNKSISPIEVQLIGIEPETDILRLYRHVVETYAQSLKPHLIKVQQETYAKAFPQAASRLVQRFTPNNSHFILLGMSNIIRPLSHSFEEGRTTVAERIRCCLDGEDFQSSKFGVAEAKAFQKILEEWNLDRLGLLSVVTRGKDELTGRYWDKILRKMLQGIGETDLPHLYENPGIKAKRGFFRNLPGSSQRGKFKVDYYYNYITLTNIKYLQNKEWQTILSAENLELAWVRTRQNILREALIDEIELRLFDHEIERKLDRLHKQILARNWQYLNIEHTLQFTVPKKADASRPKAINRIEEQILATAIIQAIGHRAEPFQKHSFSYHLNKRRNEFLYEYWLKWWKAFILSSIQNVQSRYALRADIKGFYQNVEQDKLLDIIKRTLQTEA